MANKRLSIKQMTDHGVKPLEAKRAYDAVHTAEHEAVEQHRRELLRKLTGAGLSQENVVKELSKGLAARVTIAPGPSGAAIGRPQDNIAAAWAGGKLSVAPMATAAELTRLISGWRPPKAGPRAEATGD